MSTIKEQQDEEREALISIYEGDLAFKEVNPVTFQYKYGQEDDYKSYVLELTWGDNYPEEPPDVILDAFYNRNIIPAVKTKIKNAIIEEAQNWIGFSMTYTLFECLKDRSEELLADQPSQAESIGNIVETVDKCAISAASSKVPKKEQLSKSQKRRQWENCDHKGEKARGWNWVDIVKHLSQTGGKEEGGSLPTNYDG